MERATRLWSRSIGRSTRADRVDVGIALTAALVTTAETATGNYDRGPAWVVVVMGLLLTFPLALRRRYPSGVFGVILLTIVAEVLVVGSIESVGVFIGLLVGAYTLAAHRPLRVAMLGLAALVPVMVFSNVHEGLPPLEDIEFIAALVGGLWVAGRVVWSRQQLVERLEAQAVELDRSRAAETRAIAAEERARIARDLHDVIAHNVSVMVVQAEAGEALLPDADRAGQSLRAVQNAGRAALVELRHVLGALDGDPVAEPVERPSRSPSPRLRDADQLVEQLRAAGLDVVLRTEGSPLDLQPGVDLATYRVLQEALTNALRYARGSHVEATVRFDPAEVVVEVTDDAGGPVPRTRPVDGAGRGLVTMRERVAMYGGAVVSGHVDRGFRVVARIPSRTAPSAR